jgi:predicted AAA+ superfamily ATPase
LPINDDSSVIILRIARTTVEGYFSILEDTLLLWRLPAFENRQRVRERAHPKLYWIDSGVVRSLKGAYGPLIHEERGSILEGWVANLLRAQISYDDAPVELSYLPAYGSFSEVDFILRRQDELVAIKVKNSGQVHSRSLKGLRSLRELSGVQRRILVCGITRPERTDDGIELMPITAFARESSPSHLFGEGKI